MIRISAIGTRLLAAVALAGSLLLAPAVTQAQGIYTSGTAGTLVEPDRLRNGAPTPGGAVCISRRLVEAPGQLFFLSPARRSSGGPDMHLAVLDPRQ